MADYLLPQDLDEIAPPGSDPLVVQKWISKATIRLTQLVKRRGRDLAVLAQDPDTLALIKDILENAVLRVLRNPEGLRSESEGDYSYTVNPLDSAGNVWFPAADLDQLCPRAPAVGTIRLGLWSTR